MTVLTSEFIGGPRDGEVHEHPEPMPDSLFAISFADGTRYARVGDRRSPDAVVGLFRFDPTATLARRALDAMGLPSNTPCYGPPTSPR